MANFLKGKGLSYLDRVTNHIVRNVSEEIEKNNSIGKLQLRNLDSDESILGDSVPNLTVSLTTFGKRIKDVFLAIESIGMQTLKPSRVVLWLAEDEFNDDNIPYSLRKLQIRGLTIGYCKDTRSYKKIIPSLKAYPDDLILTLDDDMMYNFDLVETLYSNYVKAPGIIYCGAARRIGVANGRLTEYNEWVRQHSTLYEASKLNMAIGFGGVLYFPGCLHNDVLDEAKFMKLSPHADDVWLKTMSLINDVKVQCVNNKFSVASKQIAIEKAQKDSLSMINVSNRKNDEQLKNVFDVYDGMQHLLK